MPISTPLKTKLSSSYPLAPSRLEDIDYAIYNYINDDLNIFTDTNQGFQKVPIIYSLPERAYQIKNNPDLRPNGRTLVYPIMSVRRSDVTQNPSNKGRYGVHVPPYFDYYKKGGSIEIARVVNQNKTKDFANANSIRKSSTKKDKNYQTFPGKSKNIVYESYSIPMPSFVEVTYEISIVTDYQQQMNEILAPFLNLSGTPSVFTIKHEGNRYEAFLNQDFTLDNNSSGLDTNERIFKTNIQIKVLGYLVGADKNQSTPNVVVRQSAAKIILQRERVMLGDEIEYHLDEKFHYRR
tara:strand:+ start:13876 stop:14757 length:882 start_codon:yes stop_codon:yes gene_type:complete